ncbi:hypothetical protein [Roseofilum casamattae]|uniref:Uncharacterized protein n=1 Tax=Roseofilum casamattae BLCC-M143 TaxID=3022442 RepID=A0ABT7C086_9CYAN|nr:hypothetical protein [Roseofilum casamattae]MDJ1184159.1 hypothetical protein [Roseofilum casamattae BLCC-M143]
MLTLESAIAKIYQLPLEQQNQVIELIELLEVQATQSSDETLHTVPNKPSISFVEATQEFMGCLDSDIEDLSHNPKYLDRFGQ